MNAPAATQRLNPAQRAALDLGRDLLVAAGAGAGKTQVLGLRVLAALETGRARVAEILAFTFTDKAAAEMRERVLELLIARIAELRAQGDSPALDNLLRAQAEFSQNRISTVHGFCHRLLSEYAWEAGLEPGAPVLDPRDQHALREAAIRRVLLHTGDDDALQRLGATTRLYALTGTLHGAIAQRHDFGRALRAAAQAWAEPDAEVARRRDAWRQIEDDLLAPVLEAARAVDFAAAARAGEADTLGGDVLALRGEMNAPSLDGLCALLLTAGGAARRYGNRGAKGKWGDPGALADARAAMGAVAEAMEAAMSVAGRYRFDEAFERRCGQVARDLHAVFERVVAEYATECAGALDFLELELRAIALLSQQPDVLRDLTARTRLILIDEYQDTNPTQSELFRLLIQADAEPGRFFAVGDAKQSIYGFRGSDVSIFNRAGPAVVARNREVAQRPQQLPWGLQAPDEPRFRQGLIDMATNYRTVAPVLGAGNAMFRSVFASDPRRLFDAEPQDMLVGNADPAPCDTPVEFHLLPRPSRSGDGPQRPAGEAEFVASRVAELAAEGVDLNDIAILVRRGTNNDQFRTAFAARGIPLLLVGDAGLLLTQEAQDCINLLRLLANQGDDLAALGVLRSPLCGMSDRELTRMALETARLPLLARLRAWPGLPGCEPARRFLGVLDGLRHDAGRVSPALLVGDNRPLLTQVAQDFASLVLRASQGDDEAARAVLRSPLCGMSDRELTRMALETARLPLLARLRAWPGLPGCEPARRFLGVLDGLRHDAERVSPALLLSRALADTGYPLAVGCGSEGEQRLANLARMVEVVRETQRQFPALAGLARELSSRGAEDEPQAPPEAGARGVRLMTVHRSKGLEFPVVIVPDLGATPGGRDTGIVRDLPAGTNEPLGLWLRSLADADRGEIRPDFAAWQAARDAAERADAEERRVLYVAWTRAKQRLILVGTAGETIKGSSWAALLLGALGVGAFGDAPRAVPPGMAVHWHEPAESEPPRPRDAQVDRLRRALAQRELPVAAPLDVTLVEPLPVPPVYAADGNPEAADFGTLVHEALERSVRGVEVGLVDARAGANVGNARAALDALAPALATLPEFGLMTPQGRRKLDLLRVLPGDVYEIVDYKTDGLPENGFVDSVRQRHGDQLRGYAGALRDYLAARGRPCNGVRLLVCLTAEGDLRAEQRLVEIEE